MQEFANAINLHFTHNGTLNTVYQTLKHKNLYLFFVRNGMVVLNVMAAANLKMGTGIPKGCEIKWYN